MNAVNMSKHSHATAQTYIQLRALVHALGSKGQKLTEQNIAFLDEM